MDVVDFAQYLYKQFRTREEELVSALASDLPKNWEEYKMIVGEIRGLAHAQDEIKALLEKTSYDTEELFSSKNNSRR